MAKPQEEDVSQLVDNDQLDRDLQPHLAGSSGNNGNRGNSTALEYVNPVLDNTESDTTTVRVQDKTAEHSTDNKTAATETVADTTTSQNGQISSSTPVVYSASNGQSSVVQEPVVIRQPNGIHVIRTRTCCDHVHDMNRIRADERPLKQRRIKLLKAFSIVAIVVFFPLGIPALYFAFKCEKEFHAGIMRGNIDIAQKMAKRCERCIIFAVMGALLTAVAVFAIIERKLVGDDEDYWRQRSHSGVFPAG